MDTSQVIQFGVLALIVAIIAILARRGQTVHLPPGVQGDTGQADSSPTERGTGEDEKGRADTTQNTVRTGGRKGRRNP